MNTRLITIAAAAAISLLSGCAMPNQQPPQDIRQGDFAVTYTNLNEPTSYKNNFDSEKRRAQQLCGDTPYLLTDSGLIHDIHAESYVRVYRNNTLNSYSATYWTCGTKAAVAHGNLAAQRDQLDADYAQQQQRLADMNPADMRRYLLTEKHYISADCNLWGKVYFITGTTPAIDLAGGLSPLYKPTYRKGAYFAQTQYGAITVMFEPARKDSALHIVIGESVHACGGVHEEKAE